MHLLQISTSLVVNNLYKFHYSDKSAELVFLQKNLMFTHLSRYNLILCIAKSFRNTRFSPYFYYYLQQVKCVIFEINSDFLHSYQLLIFLYQRTYVSPSLQKAITALSRRGFQKYPCFNIFLLVLTVGEVYNISNKHQLPNKSVK